MQPSEHIDVPKSYFQVCEKAHPTHADGVLILCLDNTQHLRLNAG